ncbi:unnamed protein product [Cylicocyclus nassatus]|uniref:Uncharacterized protein n=1 Tax=Cylicocyclus nassatus TaxID=53992 RepID=A0AA36M983_CYLNA|nr:unnamed protein product [Cylicocyclus nassatus]
MDEHDIYADDNALIHTLPYETMRDLSRILDAGETWIELATRMPDISTQDVEGCRQFGASQKGSPSEYLLRVWASKGYSILSLYNLFALTRMVRCMRIIRDQVSDAHHYLEDYALTADSGLEPSSTQNYQQYTRGRHASVSVKRNEPQQPTHPPSVSTQRSSTATSTSDTSSSGFRMVKRKRSASASATARNKSKDGPSKTVFPCSNSGLVIMLILPGERYCFYGTARVQCLAGELVVDRYRLPANGQLDFDSMYPVCAPYRMNRPALFSSPSTGGILMKYKLSRLKYRLKEITPHYEKVMDAIGEKYPAVILIDRKPSHTLRVLDQLLQDFFVPSSLRSSNEFDRTLFFKSDYAPYMELSEEHLQEALTKINVMRSKGKQCTVIPVGTSGSGKSTLVRHIINESLQIESTPIYLLDADVGQAEFTPAGCMSLWKVSKPILDVPCTHQKQSYPCAYFFGNISPADDTEKYKMIFDRLLNEFQTTSEVGSLLIINTMGWVDGLGCELLDHIFDVAQPNVAFNLSQGRGSFVIPSYGRTVLNINCKYRPFQLKLHDSHQPARLISSQMRDLAFLAYIAPVLPRPILSSICDAQPYCVEFKNITICIPDDHSYVDDRYFFATLNVQIVALCSELGDQPLDVRRLLGDETLPNISITSPSSPLLRCHGYGIIRSVDVDKKMFYLLTPLTLSELSYVTVLARGTDMLVPQLLLECQSVTSVPYLSRPALASTSGIISDLYGGLKNIRHGRREYFPSTN